MSEHLNSRLQLKHEAGGSLPPVLIAIAVGAILLSPFLAHVSSRMLATRAARSSADEQYAADSGIEFAVWHLDNDSTYRAAVNEGTDSPLSVTSNGITAGVESTALPLGAWTELADTLDTVGAGGGLAAGGDGLIYALRGNNTIQAWRYNPSSDSWSDFGVSDAPSPVDAGGSLVYKSGDIFHALRGGGSSDAWTYDSSSDGWESLSGYPGGVGAGAAITYSASHDHLYGFRGLETKAFRRYNFGGAGQGPPPNWVGAPDAPAEVSAGGALAAAGNHVYAFRGDGTNEFWRFDPGAGDNGEWAEGGDMPAAAPGAVNFGGALAWDGGDFIYALQGGNSTAFWRYSISGDSWEVMANPPAAVAAGAALTYAGSGTIYALQGNQDTGFWKFEITPPRYDIEATAGDTTIRARVEFDYDGTISVIFWDIQ